MRRIAVVATFVAAVAAGTLAACGSSQVQPSSPLPTQSATTAPSAQSTPDGAVWQWALGRNAWTDPALRRFTGSLGVHSTDANDFADGVKLGIDTSGQVVSVTLFNDQSYLPDADQPNTFHAFQGPLPGNLSWRDTASDLGAVYGAANQAGGYGSDITFTTTTDDGYRLTVAFQARHQADLPTSVMDYVMVTKA